MSRKWLYKPRDIATINPMSFHFQGRFLYCEGIKITDLFARTSTTPFYLYSTKQLRQNFATYQNALTGIEGIISYAIKANGNLTLLKMLREMESWATLVSGGELKLALAAGFAPEQLIFNGNGKTRSELKFAIETGVFINIDSDFDLAHIHQTAKTLDKPVNVLLRVNPDVDPGVHPYIATGLRESKFGLNADQIPGILDQLKTMPRLKLVGIHCHLGSTITQMDVFEQTIDIMAKAFADIQAKEFPLRYLNLGGGLGINYQRTRDNFPTPKDLIAAIKSSLPPNAILILEPGRSLVGNTGVLVCRVIGAKSNGTKNFIVIDGSMAELIRPSLYQAHHEIGFVEPVAGETKFFDIVGPICESADFLGKERELPTPPEGTGVVVYDAGAYGFAMASNYNARLRPAEYLVNGESVQLIRRGETYDDLRRQFK
jgi:diaminopimelate decarboxylase